MDSATRRLIDAVIDDRAIRTVFQPIVHLSSRSTVGFEALTRGPAGTALDSPLKLLEAANAVGRLGELDWLCRTQAIRAAADAELPETLCWFMNVEAAALGADTPAQLPEPVHERNGLRVILEFVERRLQDNVLQLIQAADRARQDGWGIAIDDVGAEEGSLALLPLLRPDVVKLDLSLIRGVPDSRASAITASVRAYAEWTGAVILAEGVENESQERLAEVFGATYAQGHFYGRPGPLPRVVPEPTVPIPVRQYQPPLDGRNPFETLSATHEPQRAAKQDLLHISAHLEAQASHGTHGSVLLAGFQHQKFFTPAKQALYRRLSATNSLTVVLAQDLPLQHDEPTYYVGPLPDGSRLASEWVLIVLANHYAAAFVARDCGDTGPDAQRRFDFIYTHNRAAVITAARCFIQNLEPAGSGVTGTPAFPGAAPIREPA